MKEILKSIRTKQSVRSPSLKKRNAERTMSEDVFSAPMTLKSKVTLSWNITNKARGTLAFVFTVSAAPRKGLL